MELMYPIIVIVCFLLAIWIFFKNFNKKQPYRQGKKVANTKYIKETQYYKSKLRKYKTLKHGMEILSMIGILMASILIARPVTVQTKNEEKYNRDIIIGLDISTSECKVNLELIKQFKKIIPNIEGDRIGIVIFNTAPIVYCPLTDDYDYINDCLDQIEKQLTLVVQNDGEVPHVAMTTSEGVDIHTFWYGGTAANAEKRGSSLIGDGLARNIIFISRFKNRDTKNENYSFCNR